MQTEAMKWPVVERTSLDTWKISEVGLHRRTVNCLLHNRIHTVGQLRGMSSETLSGWRGYGVATLQDVQKFFVWSQKLEAGEWKVTSLEEFVKDHLPAALLSVIEHRYGLRRVGIEPGRSQATLRKYGARHHLTCERVRQLQEQGLRQLRSHRCTWFLNPLVGYLEKTLAPQSGWIAVENLPATHPEGITGNYSLVGTLYFLSQVTGRIQRRHGFYAFTGKSELDRAEHIIGDRLGQAQAPLTLEQIVGANTTPLRSWIEAVLCHHSDIAKNSDGTFFLPKRFLPRLVETFLRQQSAPLHLNEITRRYNAQVQSRCPFSKQGVARLLTGDSKIERLTEGFYRLRVQV